MYKLKKPTYLPRQSTKYSQLPSIEMCAKDVTPTPAFEFKAETKFLPCSNGIKLPEKPVSLERKFHGYSRPPNFHIYSPASPLVELNEPLVGIGFPNLFQSQELEDLKCTKQEHRPSVSQTFSGENIIINQYGVIMDMKHAKKYYNSLGYPAAPGKHAHFRKKEKKRNKRLAARTGQTLASGTGKKAFDVMKLKTKTLKLQEEAKPQMEVVPNRLRRYSKNLSFRTAAMEEAAVPESPSEFSKELQEALRKASKNKSSKYPQVVTQLLLKQRLRPISKKQLSDHEKKKLSMTIQTCRFPQPEGVKEESNEYGSQETKEESQQEAESPKRRPILKQTSDVKKLSRHELQILPDETEHLHKRGKKIEATAEYIENLQAKLPPDRPAQEAPKYKGMMVKGVRSDLERRIISKRETHDRIKVVASDEHKHEKEWVTPGKLEKGLPMIRGFHKEGKGASLQDREKGQLLEKREGGGEEGEEERKERERKEREEERERRERGEGIESEEERKEREEKERREREERGEGIESEEERREREEKERREREEKEGEKEGASRVEEADEIEELREGKETSVSDLVTSEQGVGVTNKSSEGTPVDSKTLVRSSQISKDQPDEEVASKTTSEIAEKSGMQLGVGSDAEKLRQDRASSFTDVEKLKAGPSKELVGVREIRSLESLKDTDKSFLSADDGLAREKAESSEAFLSAVDRGSREVSGESTDKDYLRLNEEPEVSSSKVRFECPPTIEFEGVSRGSAADERHVHAKNLGNSVDFVDAIPRDRVQSAGSLDKDTLQMTDSDKAKKLMIKPEQLSATSFLKSSVLQESSSQETVDYDTESQIDESKREKRQKDKKSGKHKASRSKAAFDEDGEQQVPDEKQRKSGKKQAKRMAKIRTIIPIVEPEKHVIKTEETELTFKKREKKKLQDPEYVRDFVFQRRNIAAREKKPEIKKFPSETYVAKELHALEKKSTEQVDEELELSEESLSQPSEEISQESLFAEEQQSIQQKKASMALAKDFERASTKQKIFVKLDSYAINPERFQKSLLKLKVNRIFDTLQTLQPQAPKPEDVTEFITSQHEDGKINAEEYEALKETVEEAYEVPPKVEPEVTPGKVVKPLDKQAKTKVVEKAKVLPKKVKSRKFAKRMVGKPRAKIEKKKIPAIPSEEIRRKFNWVADQMRLLNELRIIHELTEPFIFSYYVNWPVMSDFANHKKKLKKEVL